MTILAQGSSTRIAYSKDGATFNILPVVDFKLDVERNDYSDNSLTGDRMKRHSISGTRQVKGSLKANLSAKNFKDIIASALNTSASASMKTGSTPQALTFEEGHSDIGQYFRSTGVVVDTLSLTVPADGLVTLDAGLIGIDQDAPAATEYGTTYNDAEDFEPMSHIGGTATIGGVANTVLTSVTIDLKNDGAANMVIGLDHALSLTTGMSSITGKATAYFPSAQEFNRFRNGTTTSFVFTVQDTAGNQYTVTLPKVKYTGASRTISGNGPVMMDISFEALKDATLGTDIMIDEVLA